MSLDLLRKPHSGVTLIPRNPHLRPSKLRFLGIRKPCSEAFAIGLMFNLLALQKIIIFLVSLFVFSHLGVITHKISQQVRLDRINKSIIGGYDRKILSGIWESVFARLGKYSANILSNLLLYFKEILCPSLKFV